MLDHSLAEQAVLIDSRTGSEAAAVAVDCCTDLRRSAAVIEAEHGPSSMHSVQRGTAGVVARIVLSDGMSVVGMVGGVSEWVAGGCACPMRE